MYYWPPHPPDTVTNKSLTLPRLGLAASSEHCRTGTSHSLRGLRLFSCQVCLLTSWRWVRREERCAYPPSPSRAVHWGVQATEREPGNIFSLKHDPVSPKSLKTGGFLYSEVSSCLALSPGEILSFYTSNGIFIKKVFIRWKMKNATEHKQMNKCSWVQEESSVYLMIFQEVKNSKLPPLLGLIVILICTELYWLCGIFEGTTLHHHSVGSLRHKQLGLDVMHHAEATYVPGVTVHPCL